jgi:type II secretory pathway pseudopilin PulG
MEQGMHRALNHIRWRLHAWRVAEQGFTLVEVLAAAVLITWGLLVLLDVLPRGLRLGELGKDQGAASALAQQKMEYCKSIPTTSTSPCPPAVLSCFVGDYGSRTTASVNPQPECFDPNGSLLAAGTTCVGMLPSQTAYFARDTQIQYWTWDVATSKYKAAAPYTVPALGTSYVFRVSVATYWSVNGMDWDPAKGWFRAPSATVFSSTGVTGCVVGGQAVPMGMGCIQVSAFIAP